MGKVLIFRAKRAPVWESERKAKQPRKPRATRADYRFSPDVDPEPVTKERVKEVCLCSCGKYDFLLSAPYKLMGPGIKCVMHGHVNHKGAVWPEYTIKTKTAMRILSEQYPLIQVAYDVLLAVSQKDPKRFVAFEEEIDRHFDNCVNK